MESILGTVHHVNGGKKQNNGNKVDVMMEVE